MSRARRPRRRFGVAVAVLALAAVGIGGVAFAHSMNGTSGGSTSAAGPSGAPGAGQPSATRTQASPVINVDGSLATPAAAPSGVATDAPSTVTAPPPPPTGRSPRQVEVVETYAEWDQGTGVSASGYVAQTVEQGGTCTLTLTRAGKKVTATGQAVPDASSTSCGGLTVAPGQLSSGTWTSVLSYASATSAGTSPAMQVTVP